MSAKICFDSQHPMCVKWKWKKKTEKDVNLFNWKHVWGKKHELKRKDNRNITIGIPIRYDIYKINCEIHMGVVIDNGRVSEATGVICIYRSWILNEDWFCGKTEKCWGHHSCAVKVESLISLWHTPYDY